MATSIVSGVRITGIASSVPRSVLSVHDLALAFGEKDAKKISQSIGVSKRHVASANTCTSDLCCAAAEKLLSDIRWARDSVDALIFVSQTPDYLLPATSAVLQHRLGLEKDCAAFDVNLGCSGYVYGLWIASLILASIPGGRGLLLAGDTISRVVSPKDRSSAPLFGDAGTATALEQTDDTTRIVFNLGTDGGGKEHLIVPAGAFRKPHSNKTAIRTRREGGNIRSDEDLFMDGAEIFTFTLREVPVLVKQVLKAAGWTVDLIDAFVMHQANQFMLQHLAKRMRLPSDKVILAMDDYGNTSCASIPLAMTVSLADRLRSTALKLLLAGFGVGFSWAGVVLTCGPLVMPPLVEL